MSKWLVENGVKLDSIIQENRSNTTFQNALLSLPILNERYGKSEFKVLLVTSSFHQFRSQLVVEKLARELAPLAEV
jgi:uncharacterized SAM-binding protein YcdF (DUF218 family)